MTDGVSPTTAAPCFDDTPPTCPVPRYQNNSLKNISQRLKR